ncbi:MAG: alpha-amylase family glycosyl hydrolase, partial [Planctomycetota bacterium]
EATSNTQEYRMPDVFRSFYGAVWMPSPSVAADPTSPGYDIADRFRFGRPGDPTIYGTEEDFRALVDQYKRANVLVYLETILNHNSGRNESFGFHEAGSWPGVWTGPVEQKSSTSNWGDFNNGNAFGYFQSENPGGSMYDLFRGDLVALCDVNPGSNNWMIRHPTDPNIPEGVQGGPNDPVRRIPAGTFVDQPDPDNARFYPDLALSPTNVFNPGFNRSGGSFGTFNTGPENWSIHPFNTADPMAGDPTMENITLMHMRWAQRMLEDFKVDGFRLDAAKHMEPWFWDRYFDAAVHNRRALPGGGFGTPFSFVEATSGNFDVWTYWVRLDGFGNRDALDLSGAGNIRNVIGGKGLGFAGDLDNQHIDRTDEVFPNNDGFMDNGSLGVNHIHSHDNGTLGDGGSAPGNPYEDKVAPWAYAYLLLRPGPPIVYHNAREFHGVRTFGFWPREGVPTALGYGTMIPLPANTPMTVEDDRIIVLNRIRHQHGRGQFKRRWEDAQVFAYERSNSCVVAVTDEYGGSFHTRTFNTDFAPGTILHELTGNATDPVVDPANDIFDTITVGAGGSVTIRIPENGPTTGEHNNGYVVYGPINPDATLTITDQATVLPADPIGTAPFARRLATIPVIQGPTFDLQVATTQADPSDPNTDDQAKFRINQGFFDFNGNGSINEDTGAGGRFAAYEGFLDVNSPLFGGGTGDYAQEINTDDLPEGYNYISVIVFRHRSSGEPIFTELREVIYVDRQNPTATVEADVDCLSGDGTITITNPDRTVTEVIANLNGGGNQTAIDWDRNQWVLPVTGLSGSNSLTLTLREKVNGVIVNETIQVVNFDVNNIAGDVNGDGIVDPQDVYAFEALTAYECRADLDGNQVVNDIDRELLRDELGMGEFNDMSANR